MSLPVEIATGSGHLPGHWLVVSPATLTEIRLVDQMMPAGGVAIGTSGSGMAPGRKPWRDGHLLCKCALSTSTGSVGTLRKVCEPNVVVHQLALSDVSGVTELWTDEGAPAQQSWISRAL